MSASGTKRTYRHDQPMSLFGGKADIGRPFRRIGSPAGSACYLFIIIVIRHETTAAAPWALLLIVRTLFNDAITIAVWTGFHVCLPVDTFAGLTRQERQSSWMLASLIIFPQRASCALMKSPSSSGVEENPSKPTFLNCA